MAKCTEPWSYLRPKGIWHKNEDQVVWMLCKILQDCIKRASTHGYDCILHFLIFLFFSVFSKDGNIFQFFFSFFFQYLSLVCYCREINHFDFLFLQNSTKWSFWISKSHTILVCAYATGLHGENKASCTVSSNLNSPCSHTLYTFCRWLIF